MFVVGGILWSEPKNTREKLQWRKRLIELFSNYCLRPRDHLSIATPFRIPRGSPFLKSVLHEMRQCFPESGKPILSGHGPEHPYDDFNNVMNVFRKQVNVHGLSDAFQEARVFSLIPDTTKDACLQKDSVHRSCDAQLIENTLR